MRPTRAAGSTLVKQGARSAATTLRDLARKLLSMVGLKRGKAWNQFHYQSRRQTRKSEFDVDMSVESLHRFLFCGAVLRSF